MVGDHVMNYSSNARTMKLCRSGNMKQHLKYNLLQKLVEISGKAVRKALGNIFYCKIVLIQLFY